MKLLSAADQLAGRVTSGRGTEIECGEPFGLHSGGGVGRDRRLLVAEECAEQGHMAGGAGVPARTALVNCGAAEKLFPAETNGQV